MKLRIRFIVLGLVACCASSHAQPAPPVSARTACTVGARSALSEIACELSGALAPAPGGLLVVASAVRSDVELRDAAVLARKIASVIAGAVGRDARAATQPADLGRARALARQAGALVHLEIELARGELRVTADVHRARTSFWERVRDPRPAPSLHTFASRRLDAELRTYLAPVPLVVSRIDKATSDEREPVALSCDDIDGDGALELLLVGRRRLATGRLRAGRFVTLAAANWADLTPVAQSPLREPIAAALPRAGAVDVGLSDRAQGVRLDGRLTALEKWGRRIPWPPDGCARFVGLALSPTLEPCSVKDPKPPAPALGHASDAVAGALVVTRAGEPRRIRAGRLFNENVVLLRDDAGRNARIQGIGAELAIADLDEDGQPELVSSADTLTPAGDALIVHTWHDDGSVRERLRVGVPNGIHAVATCPREGPGMKPIALALPGEVWVVR